MYVVLIGDAKVLSMGEREDICLLEQCKATRVSNTGLYFSLLLTVKWPDYVVKAKTHLINAHFTSVLHHVMSQYVC